MLAQQQWTIYHSFDGGHSYSRRGTLDWKGGDESLVITNDALTPDIARDILSSAWYRIKIDTTANGEYVLATVPSCHVRRANFRDEFSLIIPRVGNDPSAITSLSYTPLVSPLAPKSCDEYERDQLVPSGDIQWTSKVQVNLDTPGMTLRTILPKVKPPPGLSWTAHGVNANKGSASQILLNEGGKGGPAGATGPGGEETADSQSFFRKYWYFIVPLVLANLIPTPQDPQKATGQEGSTTETGVGGDPTAAGAGAAATGQGEGVAKRRGKRG